MGRGVYPAARTGAKGQDRDPVLLRVLFFPLAAERGGQPVSREEILEKIWGVSSSSSTRGVDNVVVKLRRKIEDNPADPRHIVTIYGTGYRLAP